MKVYNAGNKGEKMLPNISTVANEFENVSIILFC